MLLSLVTIGVVPGRSGSVCHSRSPGGLCEGGDVLGGVSVPALPLELGVLFALLALLGDFQSREKLEPCETEKEKEAEVPPEEIWHMEGAGSQKGLFSSAGRVTLST